MVSSNPRFLELLVTRGILTEQDLNYIVKEYKGNAFSLLMYLLGNEIVPKSTLGRLWGDSIGFSYVELDKTLFDREITHKLPEKFAREHQMILLYRFGDAISAATTTPTEQYILRKAESILGTPISPLFAFPVDIEEAIEIEYRSAESIEDLSSKIPTDLFLEDGHKISKEQLEKIAGNEAVIEFAREIILLGIKEKATDIHIDPGKDSVQIRFRIDGILQDRVKLEKPVLPPLVSRLKILSNADIVERRKPQDGKIEFPLPNKSIDIRFSCVPTIHGEKIVMRILGQSLPQDMPELSELYLSKDTYSKIKHILGYPNGIFFVTGPTGSGKSTTLFSALKYLNTPGINIMTIEDPVEYSLPGANQVQVNPAIHFDFAAGIRAFLRQDPDIILVGEIRDMETAKIACQAALTGHLVLTTMHTNDALQAVLRLIEIGVPSHLVAPSIVGTMAQRLVRKICEHCKQAYRLTPEQIKQWFIWDGKTEVVFYEGKGCSRCNHTGYSGRIAIHEIALINDEMRTLITRNAPISEIRKCAVKRGYRSMYYDGLKKVLRGLTTIEEINRVSVSEFKS